VRCFLLIFALWYGVNTVYAQSATSAASLGSVPTAAPAPDTAVAIHRLFAAKRRRQVILSGATLVAALGTMALVSTNSQQVGGSGSSGYGSLPSGPILDGPGVGVLAVGVIALPVALVEAVLVGGWSMKQEQQTIDGWRQHKEARFLKHRLKPKYFVTPPPTK
jgi:hypothetical protein